MKKGSPLRTLNFIFLSIVLFVLSFSAVVVTVLNVYVPKYIARIDGEDVAYFESPAEFDEVYETLVAEKKADGLEVKVYLNAEPTYELKYVRESTVEEQNQYTNLRAFVNTEYTVYDVAVNGTVEMTLSSDSEAQEYAKKLKDSIRSSVGVEVKPRNTPELVAITDSDTAKNTYNSLVSRYKPVVRTYSYSYAGVVFNYQLASGELYSLMAGGRNPTNTAQTVLTQGFGRSSVSFYSLHRGVDIASYGGAAVDIFAYKSGVVSAVQTNPYVSTYGCYVKVYHGNTSDGTEVYTLYAHLKQGSIRVNVGDSVTSSTVLGNMGNTGRSTGVHLHFEMQSILNGVQKLHNPSLYISY